VILLLALLLVVIAIRLWRGRTRRYITAQIGSFPTINLQKGPDVGFSFITNSANDAVSSVARDIKSSADVRIKFMGGAKFSWRQQGESTFQEIEPNGTFVVRDRVGGAHEVRLRPLKSRPKGLQSSSSLINLEGGDSPVASWDSGITADGWGDSTTGNSNNGW
jgi:hypothetical protein